MVLFIVFMAGRIPRLACIAFTAVLLGMARQGHAQLEYRLSAGSSAGVSNISGSQSGATAGVQTDVFLMARAGAQLEYAGRLVQNQAAYAFAATWWVRGQTWSLSHTLNLSSAIQTSATTQVTLGGSATLSQLSLADTVAAADPQTVGARPAGTQEFAAFDAHEAFAWQLNGAWRLDQLLDGRLFRPIGDNPGSSQNESLALTLGIARLWQRDQAGLQTRVGVIETGGVAPVGQAQGIPGRESEFAETLLTWRHDWTPTWTSEIGAGALVLHVPGNDTSLTPAGSATAAYHNTGQELELRAARTVEPNVYVGAALERDLVSVRAGLPIGRWQALRLDAMVDVEHDSGAGTLGGPTSTANILFLQAGAHYQPGNMFVYRLQYTFRDQFSASAAPGTSPFSAFSQQMVMFTVEVRYPPAVATAPRPPKPP